MERGQVFNYETHSSTCTALMGEKAILRVGEEIKKKKKSEVGANGEKESVFTNETYSSSCSAF